MGAQIHFQPEGPKVTDSQNRPLSVLTVTLEDEYRLHQELTPPNQNIDSWLQNFPEAWAETGGLGLAKHRPAIFVELKPGMDPVRVRQYPMALEAKEGIIPHIRRLLDHGVLRPCHSPWNTPLLPIQKPNSKEYRPVQDLREVNKRVMDIHPTVPNPYTLLSTLSPENQWYTVLDLKDAFFSLPLAPKSQEIFAFEWTDSERGISGQLTWTRLPQGFKNSPTLFDEALHEDLGEYRRQHPSITLLQYVDDLLIAATSPEACIQGTKDLLKTLGNLGYRASAKKAQICRPEVTYLGYLLRGGQRWLTNARKETVLQIPRPQSTRQVREFLGSAGFCRLWIPGFAELAKPLYQATKEQQPFNWTEEAEQAFQQIKTALLSAPALGLPDVSKPFHLYVDESRGIAKAVLTQNLGPWRRPVAYLSKRLDPVAAGWPPCLRMIAATALMVKDANKLAMGQELQVTTPHAVEGILRQPPDRWLSNARLTHYQGLLLNPLRITFKPPTTLNPASLLPDPDLSKPLHNCAEILAQVHGVREDLQDRPLPDADLTWFTDGSSFVHQGQRYAGAAVTSETEIVWAEPLPPGTSAQKAELIALAQALKLGKDRKLTVYTDSRYAFATAHIHGAIYRERGLLTAEGKDIKNKEEILNLLAALWEPKKLAIVHCPGHQKATNPVTRGNNLADQTAKDVAKTTPQLLALQLPDPGPRELPFHPEYSEEDLQWISKLPGTQPYREFMRKSGPS
ncbi:PREDICTED: retrovirus-related Pol polyprotein from transposon 17.6 isoform X3 [Rhinopithecus bieti]|uniref:retrovirus-related Pol polyprotein from transposon 17.6 isoform X3 n=1 Tax=Rhinopithecus bieti TaxID=61621 RepID=UPI00083BB18D|nr:PREDICTED: retrovirus-related Pol polyprotein from transposon 17.6 isoform X3 [Rhinopithecus bieti]